MLIFRIITELFRPSIPVEKVVESLCISCVYDPEHGDTAAVFTCGHRFPQGVDKRFYNAYAPGSFVRP